MSMSFASQTFAASAARVDNTGRTFNGAATNITTHSACLDFFANAPAMRGKNAQALILFRAAYNENRDIALRTLLWLRDARGGAGERDTFRAILTELCTINPTDAALIVLRAPEMGRWDDIYAATGTVRPFALAFMAVGLDKGDRLAAKWAKREGPHAEALRSVMGLSPKAYRQKIVALSNTVEQKMCAQQWDQINFSHVPSVAAKRYQKAFNKRAAAAYAAYKAALVKGDGSAKVNASAIFPHDVLVGLKRGDAVVAEAQWNALPNYLGENGGILPLVDLSSSMNCPLGGSGSVLCRDVAIALGLYTSERLTGAFQNLLMTFSSTARVVTLNNTQTLEAKVDAVGGRGYDRYMGSTNIEAAFRKILEIAIQGNVPAEDMPKYLLILSDMEFNSACRNQTALDMVKAAYVRAGYVMPNIVFWNLNARLGNNPVTIRDDGTALVGGYSPSLLKSILAAKNFTPEDIMLETVMSDRYVLTSL